ncbi:MAG: type IV pilin [Candidatus Bathyarchaeota archaeon]|nr:type IV pilin [Candidatus Bathyarchaeota archaeon]
MKRILRNNKGVSTIVATALLVALVVILGVALASTVPQATIAQKPLQLQLQGTASLGENELRITNVGGDTVNTQVIALSTYITSGAYAGQKYVVDINQNLDSENEDPYRNFYYAVKEHPHPVDSAGHGGEFGPGETLVLNLDYCFEYGFMMQQVEAGYQFIVEISMNSQPVTATTVTVSS